MRSTFCAARPKPERRNEDAGRRRRNEAPPGTGDDGAFVSSCLYGRLPMARPIWHVWRAGCSFISGLLVQGFVLLALMESADPAPHLSPELYAQNKIQVWRIAV